MSSTLKEIEIGDLVRNLNSECGLFGIVTGWNPIASKNQTPFIIKVNTPVVSWADGRVGWIMPDMVEVVLKNE